MIEMLKRKVRQRDLERALQSRLQEPVQMTCNGNDSLTNAILTKLAAKLKKKMIQPNEWQAFQNAMQKYGININDIDLHQISNEEDFDKIIQMAGLSQRQAPQDDQEAYLEKMRQMQALKDKVRQR